MWQILQTFDPSCAVEKRVSPGTVAARLIDFHFVSKPGACSLQPVDPGKQVIDEAGNALMTVRFCLPIKGR
jgi:hypothetical protein